MTDHPAPELSAYLDDELPASQRQQVDEHLHQCPLCRAELAELAGLRRLLASVPSPAASLDSELFWQGMRQRLGTQRRFTRWIWLLAAVLVFSVALSQALLVASVSANLLAVAGLGPSIWLAPSQLSWLSGLAPVQTVIDYWADSSLIGMFLEQPISAYLPYVLSLGLSLGLALFLMGWLFAALKRPAPPSSLRTGLSA